MDYYKNKLVLITGGSSGIGFAMAKELASLEANVWILARREERLENAVKEIENNRKNPNQKFGCIKADVTNEYDINHRLASFMKTVGVPDILVNCAGDSRPGLFEELDIEIFRWLMNVNFFGTLYPIKALIPGMLERRSGQVINIASIAGYAGIFGYSAYGSSKFAVRGLTDTLRSEYKNRGIRFSVAFPGDTDTPQLAEENKYKPAVVKELSESNIGVSKPEVTAHEIIKAATKGKYIILTDSNTKLQYVFVNILMVFNLFYRYMDLLVSQAERNVAKKNGLKN